MLVKFTMLSGESVNLTLNKNMKISKYFTLEEAANNKGDSSIAQYVITPDSQLFAVMADEMRERHGGPIVPYSWYRQSKFNASVGGDANSAHLQGCAIDWHIKLTDAEYSQKRNDWRTICTLHHVVGEINRYTNGIHFGINADKNYGNVNFVERDYRGKKGDW